MNLGACARQITSPRCNKPHNLGNKPCKGCKFTAKNRVIHTQFTHSQVMEASQSHVCVQVYRYILEGPVVQNLI